MLIISLVSVLRPSRFPGEYDRLIKSYRAIGYNVSSKIVNTRKWGIPHNRERLYVVGVRLDIQVNSFYFPDDIGCPSVKEFVDFRNKRHTTNQSQPEFSLFASGNAIARLSFIMLTRGSIWDRPKIATFNAAMMVARKKAGLELCSPEAAYIVDCGASEKFVVTMKDCCPCLTASRKNGHWLPALNRYLDLHEIMRLQGLQFVWGSLFVFRVNDAMTTIVSTYPFRFFRSFRYPQPVCREVCYNGSQLG